MVSIAYKFMLKINHILLHIGPKGDNAGDSQDDDGTEEEEIAVGRVNDGEDDDIEDERETGVITGGVEESWTVSSTLVFKPPALFGFSSLPYCT